MESTCDLGIVQKATTGIYREKCDKTFKSKKGLRRHLIKGHETIGKPACESRNNMFNRRTDSRVHAYKFHEHGNDDEAEVKPNSKSIKKANKNGIVTNMIQD